MNLADVCRWYSTGQYFTVLYCSLYYSRLHESKSKIHVAGFYHYYIGMVLFLAILTKMKLPKAPKIPGQFEL